MGAWTGLKGKCWARLAQGKIVKKRKLDLQISSYIQPEHSITCNGKTTTVFSCLSLEYMIGIPISDVNKKIKQTTKAKNLYIYLCL